MTSGGSSYEWKETYSSKSTSGDTSKEGRCCQTDVVFDKRYLTGIPGVLKYIEIGCSLIAFICVEAASGGNAATMGYFKFISLLCFIMAVFLWVFLLFKLEVRLVKCECCNWVFVEMMIYVVLVVLLFFGDLFLSLHGHEAGHKAGVVFGWALFTALCLDLIYMMYNYCRGRTTTLHTTTTSTSRTTASTTVSDPEAGRY